VSVASLAPNTIAIGSFTKAYGLGALRLGWLVLGEGLALERERIEDGAFLDYVDPPTPILRLGVRALQKLDELRAPYERFRRVSRPLLGEWLAATPGVDGSPPEHGLICFPRIAGVSDTAALHEHLVREHDVDVVPGEFFGTPGHVRIGYGLEPEALGEALARLAAGIESFRTSR
jgi:aspartate/methionine/tyrosine aminotransferase